ncbi:outer membrane protein OmpK [Thalassomonas sp. M1454]|uniref:outer membrane protein OmpK n=1 Tax=Thalassomonas sp. M1454 TaxID=2594477 RepID=UPI00117FA08A|nr:outer membrane protein OmpK [Thalassomonas sp. M1454]TRX56966.1 ion channel protein Tsx [Thalassomonas sp. M1454]
MNTTLKKLSSVILAGASLMSFNAQAEMFWSDNSLSLLKNQGNYEVATNDDITVITVEHASGHNWGDLFFFADRLDYKEDSQSVAANETYSELSPRLSLSYATGSKMEFGIISDVFIATTWEHSTFESDPIILPDGFMIDIDNRFDNYLVGVGVDLKLPGFAFFNVNLYQANNEQTDNDNQLTAVWGYPFSIGNADFMFDGFIDWSSAEETHAADFHFNPQLRMDIGKYFGVPKKFEAGIEYSYWHNKFGIKGLDDESVISWMVKIHL